MIRNLLNTAFVLGALAFIVWESMLQDLMGKEKFIKYVNKHWRDTKWWMWLIIFLILIRMFQYIKKVSNEQ